MSFYHVATLGKFLMQVLRAHHALWAGILQPEDIGLGGETFKDVVRADNESDEDDGIEAFVDAPAAPEEGSNGSDDSDEEMVIAQRQSSQKAIGALGRGLTSGRPPSTSGAVIGKAPGGRQVASDADRWPKEGCYDMNKR